MSTWRQALHSCHMDSQVELVNQSISFLECWLSDGQAPLGCPHEVELVQSVMQCNGDVGGTWCCCSSLAVVLCIAMLFVS